MSLLIFLAVLSVLVLVHEWGHYITARRLGVKVEKFALGFGPKLFSKQVNETEFMVCAFPLGGYVKMAGDERTSCKGDRDEYYSHPPGHRALIVLMGPVVNYVMAYLCFVVVFMIGYPTLSPKVGEVMDAYPAQVAGLQKEDKIIAIDSQEVKSWDDIQKFIATSKNDVINFTLLREGQTITKTIVPKMEVLENIFHQKETVRIIGIKPKEELAVIKYGFFESISESGQSLWEITTTTYKALYRMATGAMKPSEAMTGPIGIFLIIKKASALGFSYLLYIMGVISASLAIFNLLPLPILDGGHIFLLGLEKLRCKALSIKVEETISKVGFSLIICLAVFVFYIDLDRIGIFDKVIGLWNKFRL